VAPLNYLAPTVAKWTDGHGQSRRVIHAPAAR
jgi:hypothetical protein